MRRTEWRTATNGTGPAAFHDLKDLFGDNRFAMPGSVLRATSPLSPTDSERERRDAGQSFPTFWE
jgi:hypothetical protein